MQLFAIVLAQKRLRYAREAAHASHRQGSELGASASQGSQVRVQASLDRLKCGQFVGTFLLTDREEFRGYRAHGQRQLPVALCTQAALLADLLLGYESAQGVNIGTH